MTRIKDKTKDAIVSVLASFSLATLCMFIIIALFHVI